MNRHDAKTEPSSLDEEQAKVLDAMEPMASTTRQLGFMHSQGIATADLKGDFADDKRRVQLLSCDQSLSQYGVSVTLFRR